MPLRQARGGVRDGLPAPWRRAENDPHAITNLVARSNTHCRPHRDGRTRYDPKVLRMLSLLKNDPLSMAILTNRSHALTVQVTRDSAWASASNSLAIDSLIARQETPG